MQPATAAVAEAVSYCGAALTHGVAAATAERALDRVSDEVWKKVTNDRTGRYCQDLARRARDILDRGSLIDGLGRLAALLLGMHVSAVVHIFAHDIAVSLPMTSVLQKSTATARSLQVTGIYNCVTNGRDLARCACFIDVANEGGKEMTKQLLLAGARDWAGLDVFTPPP